MKITVEHKFEIGDWVWVMPINKPVLVQIVRIDATWSSANAIDVYYQFRDEKGNHVYAGGLHERFIWPASFENAAKQEANL